VVILASLVSSGRKFEEILGLNIFTECFRGPPTTTWRATFGPRAANCPPLAYGLRRNSTVTENTRTAVTFGVKRLFFRQNFVITFWLEASAAQMWEMCKNEDCGKRFFCRNELLRSKLQQKVVNSVKHPNFSISCKSCPS